jgi:hypothetical protein
MEERAAAAPAAMERAQRILEIKAREGAGEQAAKTVDGVIEQ